MPPNKKEAAEENGFHEESTKYNHKNQAADKLQSNLSVSHQIVFPNSTTTNAPQGAERISYIDTEIDSGLVFAVQKATDEKRGVGEEDAISSALGQAEVDDAKASESGKRFNSHESKRPMTPNVEEKLGSETSFVVSNGVDSLRSDSNSLAGDLVAIPDTKNKLRRTTKDVMAHDENMKNVEPFQIATMESIGGSDTISPGLNGIACDKTLSRSKHGFVPGDGKIVCARILEMGWSTC